MSSADYLDLKQELISGFPPGTEDWLDWLDPDGPGPLMEATGHVLEDRGTAQVDALRLELSPLTCSAAGLARWERTLDLQNSRITLRGDTERRRAQVLSRLREVGNSNKRMVQTILNSFLLYADQTQIELMESNRSQVRTANEKRHFGVVDFGPGAIPPTAQISWVVWDDPRVSKGGVQVDLNVTCSDLSTLEISLYAPDGAVYSQVMPLGVGGRTAGPGGVNLRIYEPRFAGHGKIFGTWRMSITSANVGDSLLGAVLLVEGLGRYDDWRGVPCNGLGAAMYEWGVVVDAALLGTDYDLDGARHAVRRLSYARSIGNIIRKPFGGLIAIPDEPWTIPDEVVPGF